MIVTKEFFSINQLFSKFVNLIGWLGLVSFFNFLPTISVFSETNILLLPFFFLIFIKSSSEITVPLFLNVLNA